MHTINTFFGHLHVLARYVGEPDRPILGYLQHGWDERDPMPDAPHLRFPPKLMWNERNVEGAREAGLSNFVLIGAEYLYLEGGNTPGPIVPAVSRDVIVYPYHSWDYDTDDPRDRPGPARDDRYRTGHAAYAHEIAERESGDVTIALYWRDYEEDAARRPYEELGFRVITHGNRYDREFLLRQRAEQLGHRRAVTNRIGTAVWYAAHAGCALEVYGPFMGSSTAEARWFKDVQRRRWPELFEGGVTSDVARALAAEELGVRWKREPEELAEILGWRGWRRRVTPAVELVDRIHHKLRWSQHRRRAARRPPPWATA